MLVQPRHPLVDPARYVFALTIVVVVAADCSSQNCYFSTNAVAADTGVPPMLIATPTYSVTAVVEAGDQIVLYWNNVAVVNIVTAFHPRPTAYLDCW